MAQASAGLMVLREAPLFQFAVSPNKLFDYYAAGLPVVTNVGGEVGASVSGAGAGIETDNASSAALARAVRKLAQLDIDDRRRMGLAGRAWVTREHDRPALARRLAQLLDELKAVAALA